jgi:aminocarboxymuconate-semialdehyde decarboxylase
MNIDVHAHHVPAESLKTAAEVGARHGLKLERTERGRDLLTRDGKPFLNQLKGEFSDLELRLSIMDQQGVDLQVLSPPPSYFFYWMPAAQSVEFVRWLNDRLAQAVAKHPQRFVALASVPLQDGAAAAAELERAMNQLGLRGAEIASNINGRYLDDPGFEPFWEAAQALDALIFVHPNQVVGAERMKDFQLANLIGNPTDTSLAFAKLIFSGVLERYPRLKFLLAHAGGFLPYTWGRLDRGYQIQDSAARKISKPPSEYIKLLHFDTIAHSRMALEYLIANFGADHVLLGSDYPYDMGDPEPVATLGAARIDPTQMAQVAGANACKLFRIGI